MEHVIKSIAHIENGYTDKFGIPRQSNLVNSMVSKIIFEEEYRSPESIRGLLEFSHIWLIWQFSLNVDKGWTNTVRPPRLGGNERRGVFATRSPFRPNGMGLSSVKIQKIDYEDPKGPVICVTGADLMDGTPIFDIKPYIPMSDMHLDAKGGFSEENRDKELKVVYDEKVFEGIFDDQKETIIEVLKGDPRPAYHKDPDRIYGFYIYDREVKFCVNGDILRIEDIL